MTEAQFVRNHRGIDQGKDPPKDLLEGMYRRIKVKADLTYTQRLLFQYLMFLLPCFFCHVIFGDPTTSSASMLAHCLSYDSARRKAKASQPHMKSC